MTSDWIQFVGAILSAGGLGTVLGHMRKARKDNMLAQETSSTTMLKYWSQITEEQRDWRQTLRAEIAVLQEQLNSVRAENAGLLRKVAELDAHNADLKRDNEEIKRDNEELEARVKELERELRKHDTQGATV